MCGACGNLCCSEPQTEGCGCEHCFDPACMPSVCKSCNDPKCPATDGIELCLHQDEVYEMETDFIELGI